MKDPELLDFDWALGLNRFSLRLMGVWPADQDEKSIQTALRAPLMILVSLFSLFLPQMYALVLIINQLPLVIDNIMTSCPTITSCMKLFFTWRSRRVLQPVIDSALQDYRRPKSRLEKLVMHREAYLGRLITIVDITIFSLCFVGFIILPMLGLNIRNINNITDYGQHALIVQSYYPFDYTRSPIFELTHVIQLIGCFFVAMAVLIPDDYFCVLVLHASAQFQILGLQIESLVKNDDGQFDKRLLKHFIERHIHLNKVVSTVEKSFAFIIIGQILCMSTMVCCLGVQVLSMLDSTADQPNPRQVLTIAATIIALMMHTFVNCFVSENLTSRSSEVLFRIYSSRWYVMSWRNKRCLVPMMVIAKTPREIKAGKILPMSMDTYCSIVKSTAGYISMLIAVSGR